MDHYYHELPILSAPVLHSKQNAAVDTTNSSQKERFHKMSERLPDNMRSEIFYYIKHLLHHFTFCKVLDYCSPVDLSKFKEDSCAITCFIENLKWSLQNYINNLRVLQPKEAPVLQILLGFIYLKTDFRLF
jgi:hypothetical protein